MGTTTYSTHTVNQATDRMDLRRRQDQSLSDILIRRAHWLMPDDRELILAYFRDNRSAASLAHMLGTDARHLRRRIKQLVARLCDPRVAYVVSQQAHWSALRRDIARRLFIEGRSMRELTNEMGLSIHTLRTHRDAVEAMCAAASDRAAKRPSHAWRTTNKGTLS